MGKQVVELANQHAALTLASAADGPSSPALGQTLPGSQVKVDDSLDRALSRAQVYIDFTTPASTREAAQMARAHKTAAVVGTTGLDAEAEAALAELSKVAPVFVAANFSPGVSLLLHLAEKAASALGPDYDLEVVELHHRNKVDSPSGTALALGQALAQGRGVDFDSARLTERQGQVGARTQEEIGIFAVRGGDIVGEHTAYLIGNEERIEITHRAQKRSVFAAGALRAAEWLAGQKPGRYGMSDLLGF
jgi:4-hydroxy-tetrahydrodipicolinate reductase